MHTAALTGCSTSMRRRPIGLDAMPNGTWATCLARLRQLVNAGGLDLHESLRVVCTLRDGRSDRSRTRSGSSVSASLFIRHEPASRLATARPCRAAHFMIATHPHEVGGLIARHIDSAEPRKYRAAEAPTA